MSAEAMQKSISIRCTNEFVHQLYFLSISALEESVHDVKYVVAA